MKNNIGMYLISSDIAQETKEKLIVIYLLQKQPGIDDDIGNTENKKGLIIYI